MGTTKPTHRPPTEAEERADKLTALSLPIHAEHVSTHNIEKALESLDLAAAQTRPDQQRLYLERAQSAITMARQNMLATLGHWRGYNERANQLVAELLKDEEHAA